MPKDKKKRTFESEILLLPALKMVLLDPENDKSHQSTKKEKQKIARDLNEETVLRIIDRLIAKD
jgi:hypothetical protein